MINRIDDTTKEFIKLHINDAPYLIALSKNKYNDIDIDYAIKDISSRSKLINKMPLWADNFDLIMPNSLNIQQTSSSLTALFKSKFCENLKTIDLTGGFGIDSYYMSLKSKNHHYVEPDKHLFDITSQNFNTLGIQNVKFFNSSAQEFLANNNEKFDLVYLDPSRRNSSGRRAFLIQDCEPNILQIFDDLKNMAYRLLIKLSPMLDIDELIQLFPEVSNIFIISVSGECKEVLLDFDFRNKIDETIMHAIELADLSFSHQFKKSFNNIIDYSDPKLFIFEFHAAISKSGFSDFFANSFGLTKIAQNTTLYTSDTLSTDNAFKSYRTIQLIKPDAKLLRQFLPDMKAVVVRKNFPLSVVEIRRKYKIIEGDNLYVFAVRLMNGKTAFILAEQA